MPGDDRLCAVHVVRPQRLHRPRQERALLERESVPQTEVRDSLAARGQLELGLDELRARDVFTPRPGVAPKAVAQVLHQEARDLGRLRDIGESSRKGARKIEGELAEQQEPPELIGDRRERLAFRHQLEAQRLFQQRLRLRRPSLARLERFQLFWAGREEGEKDLAGGLRLQAGSKRRPGQAPSDVIDQREGRGRVFSEQAADLGGVIELGFQADAFVGVSISVGEDGSAGGVDRKRVRLPLFVRDRGFGRDIDQELLGAVRPAQGDERQHGGLARLDA